MSDGHRRERAAGADRRAGRLLGSAGAGRHACAVLRRRSRGSRPGSCSARSEAGLEVRGRRRRQHLRALARRRRWARRPSPPARTSMRFPTPAGTTASSACSERSKRSAPCVERASSRADRSRSSSSRPRSRRVSASAAWEAACSPGRARAERAAALAIATGARSTSGARRAGSRRTGPRDRARSRSGHYAAFVELHIEQGPLLERDGIADRRSSKRSPGPSSYRLRAHGRRRTRGRGAHARSTRRRTGGRRDRARRRAGGASSGSPDTVGTTGVFRQRPGAINSIPCDVTLEIDFRDTRLETRDAAWSRVEAAIAEICRRRGVRWTLDTLNADAPARARRHSSIWRATSARRARPASGA